MKHDVVAAARVYLAAALDITNQIPIGERGVQLVLVDWRNSIMSVKSLDHIHIAMPRGREAEARAFYQDLLGIREVAKPPNLAKRGGCWFESGALKVHLGVEADFRPARKAHPAFIVAKRHAMLVRALRRTMYRTVRLLRRQID